MGKTRKQYGTRSYPRSFKPTTEKHEYEATINGKVVRTTATTKGQARRAFEARYGVLLPYDHIREVQGDSRKIDPRLEPAQKPAQTTEEIQIDLFPH